MSTVRSPTNFRAIRRARPAAIARVARVWNIRPERVARRGLTAAEIFGSLGGAVRSLFVMGSNPVVSAPDAGALREKLASADHVVVCDFFVSETAAQAHVVLPAPQWAEEAGAITNLEGRVLRRERCADAPSLPRGNLAILMRLGGSPKAFAQKFFAPLHWGTDLSINIVVGGALDRSQRRRRSKRAPSASRPLLQVANTQTQRSAFGP